MQRYITFHRYVVVGMVKAVAVACVAASLRVETEGQLKQINKRVSVVKFNINLLGNMDYRKAL